MGDKGETKYYSLVSLEHLVDMTFAKMGVIEGKVDSKFRESQQSRFLICVY